MKAYKIAAVVAEFNYNVTNFMLERAKAEADFLGVEISHVVEVPGVFDMPLVIKKLLARDDVDAVITLGAVITGQTKHDEVIAAQASRQIMDLALASGKPVALGVTGPGMAEMEAMDRIEKGRDCVDTVVKLLQRMEKI